jgi:hypothetical protein
LTERENLQKKCYFRFDFLLKIFILFLVEINQSVQGNFSKKEVYEKRSSAMDSPTLSGPVPQADCQPDAVSASKPDSNSQGVYQSINQSIPPKPPTAKVRRLERNLRSQEVIKRIQEAERRLETSERELGFYLREVLERSLYQDFNCRDFKQFVRLKTGLSQKKAKELIRVSRALDSLPALDKAFANGEIYWSAVRSIVSVATPQTDEEWTEFAKTHRTDTVPSPLGPPGGTSGANGGKLESR